MKHAGRVEPRTGTPPPRGEPRTGRGFAGDFHACGEGKSEEKETLGKEKGE